ncbi:uncharacterized protein LOC119562320 [Drosophila subpulchrella]|uniref:uncharacterized protein LOC119562320 n=1 Tax=Drosophila subpulchrella TaxID=1486046 RepID=UPI0018A181C9|nr:uncharacterized protein LOC119562320 [Drosophila subpulchrella]
MSRWKVLLTPSPTAPQASDSTLSWRSPPPQGTTGQHSWRTSSPPVIRDYMIVSMASFSNRRVNISGDTDIPHTLLRLPSSCCSSGDSGCGSTNFDTVCRMNRLLNIVLPNAPAVPPPRRHREWAGRGRGAAGAGRGLWQRRRLPRGSQFPRGTSTGSGR